MRRRILVVDCLVASLAIASAFSPSFVVHRNGAVLSHMTTKRRRHDGTFAGGQSLHRQTPPATRLDMMFDQLSSALTEVAQNFGGKQR
jgi:hypothetical protein